MLSRSHGRSDRCPQRPWLPLNIKEVEVRAGSQTEVSELLAVQRDGCDMISVLVLVPFPKMFLRANEKWDDLGIAAACSKTIPTSSNMSPSLK